MLRARHIALQIYRLAVLVAIAWVIRTHHVRLRIDGDAPISIEEIRAVLPGTGGLRADSGERAGVFVVGETGQPLGYALRTAPISDSIVGYRGATDSLVVFDSAMRVIGVRIRSSQDTREHVGDVREDREFLKTWNGKPWDEVVRVSPEEAGIEGVSGASMTSMAIADGIQRRLASADAAGAIRPASWRVATRDVGLALVVSAACLLAFTGTYGRPWLRRSMQTFVIVYVGFVTGDLLAQSLIVGWMQSGVPWRTAPGLVLLLAAALAVPWATGKPLYCQHICPHGAAQELLHRLAPKGWRFALPSGVDAGLRWLPPLLLAFVLIVSMLGLPIDLAHVEAFDAYLFRTAGLATVIIAIVGLVASLFVPMAYCHYGCPTGAFLTFIRGHGRADHFGRRDVSAVILLGLAALLSWKCHALRAWMVSGV